MLLSRCDIIVGYGLDYVYILFCVRVDFNMFVGNLDSSRTMWLSQYIASIVLDRGPVVKRPI